VSVAQKEARCLCKLSRIRGPRDASPQQEEQGGHNDSSWTHGKLQSSTSPVGLTGGAAVSFRQRTSAKCRFAALPACHFLDIRGHGRIRRWCRLTAELTSSTLRSNWNRPSPFAVLMISATWIPSPHPRSPSSDRGTRSLGRVPFFDTAPHGAGVAPKAVGPLPRRYACVGPNRPLGVR